MWALKIADAARRSAGFTALGRSAPASTRDSKSPGLSRRNAVSISAASASRRRRSSPGSARRGPAGVNCMRPRPSSTSAVGPSAVSATNARPGRHLDDQVRRVHGQVVDVVLLGGVEREAVQAGDDRQPGDRGNLPGIGWRGSGLDVDAPGAEAPFDSVLAEHFDDQPLSAFSSGARSRSFTTTRVGAGVVSDLRKLLEAGAADCRCAEREDPRAVSGRRRSAPVGARSAAMPSRGGGWAPARSTATPAAASISTTQHAAGARYGRIEASILDPVPAVSRQPFMDHAGRRDGIDGMTGPDGRTFDRRLAWLLAGDAGGRSVRAPRCRRLAGSTHTWSGFVSGRATGHVRPRSRPSAQPGSCTRRGVLSPPASAEAWQRADTITGVAGPRRGRR